jgi:hypothetical protein
MATERNDRRKKYLAMELKQIPNDYTNSFLNHFGFCDYPRSENESAALLKYNTWEQGKKGFNK